MTRNDATYDASVPVFLRYLSRLSALVAKAEVHCTQEGIDPESILQARLAPDMHPFRSQVHIATDFAMRTCAPLAKVAKPDHGDAQTSLVGLRMKIGKAIGFLEALSPSQFASAADGIVVSQAGQAALELNEMDFLRQYALPNFLFHVSMAYAILRHAGVNIGKRDFDGFHKYEQAC